MDRKKKLLLIQASLLILGVLIIFHTYSGKNPINKEKISQTIEGAADPLKGNTFFDIEYSGIDLSGNRYIIKSEEAQTNNLNQELVNMKNVNAFFYFKDDTILKINSDYGIYNNKTLDMIFKSNIKAVYEKSVLYAQNAEYSNSGNFLSVFGEVEINDLKGRVFADKLLFDIKKQKLNISSYRNNKINANLNLK